jgi:hypothetical protein
MLLALRLDVTLRAVLRVMPSRPVAFEFEIRTTEGVTWCHVQGSGGRVGDGALYITDTTTLAYVEQRLLARVRLLAERGPLYIDGQDVCVQEVCAVRIRYSPIS